VGAGATDGDLDPGAGCGSSQNIRLYGEEFDEDRTVEIYGPNDEVVRIVKTGKEVQTSSEKDSKYRNRQARRIAALSRVRGFVLQLILLDVLDHFLQHSDRLLSQPGVAAAASVDA
jgi:hypothetical protein